MPIPVLVENVEVFARLNYLRDLVMDTDMDPWSECKDSYLEEAASSQVQEGYVLTLDEIKLISSKLYR